MLLANFVVLHLLLMFSTNGMQKESNKEAERGRKRANECKLKDESCVFASDVMVGDDDNGGGELKTVYLWVCVDCVCQFWGGVARGKREPVFLQ